MENNERIKRFWSGYLRSLPPGDRDRRYFEAFTFGDTAEAADRIARLVVAGVKTATSELLWTRQAAGEPLWGTGDESIVLDGSGDPVCVVRTVELRTVPFEEVEEEFVRDYGEGEGTLEWWRRDVWEHYQKECRSLGRTPTGEMPVICERFEVVYLLGHTGPTNPP
ncbi:MAG: ASCH domain-containing protein [Actinomycetota bacterium]